MAERQREGYGRSVSHAIDHPNTRPPPPPPQQSEKKHKRPDNFEGAAGRASVGSEVAGVESICPG